MKAVLKLDFENKQAKYVPGEILKGTIIIESNEQWKAEYGEAVLRWIAQKEKIKDESVVEGKKILENTLISPHCSYPFSFTLPVTPWSYQGRFFQIKWIVSVLIRPENKSPMRTEREITIHPQKQGKEIDSSPSLDSNRQHNI